MTAPTERKSRWIPWVFVGMFAVVTSVNAVMIWFALTTFTGLDHGDPYGRGIAYNDVLAEERAQARLGWAAAVLADADGLDLRVEDRLQQPLDGAVVSARVRRPVDAGLDFDAVLEPTAAGQYHADIDWPARGQWDVFVTIERAGQRYQQEARVHVR